MFSKQGGKFVYAFSKEDAELLASCGYRFLKKDERLGIFVFENNNALVFEQMFKDRNIWTSDTLSF